MGPYGPAQNNGVKDALKEVLKVLIKVVLKVFLNVFLDSVPTLVKISCDDILILVVRITKKNMVRMLIIWESLV